MVVKVALWYELWTSLMDLCCIIFLFSDLVTEEALIVLHTDEMEEVPNKERTGHAHRGCHFGDPLPPPHLILVLLQMCLSLLERPHLRPQQP
jgi:hypothetical protein